MRKLHIAIASLSIAFAALAASQDGIPQKPVDQPGQQQPPVDEKPVRRFEQGKGLDLKKALEDSSDLPAARQALKAMAQERPPGRSEKAAERLALLELLSTRSLESERPAAMQLARAALEESAPEDEDQAAAYLRGQIERKHFNDGEKAARAYRAVLRPFLGRGPVFRSSAALAAAFEKAGGAEAASAEELQSYRRLLKRMAARERLAAREKSRSASALQR